METERTDRELIEAAQSGDEQALNALVERYQGAVYRFGLQMCGNAADAQDVLQETLLAMARSLDGFRGDSTVSTWLYTIARRFCGKRHRKRVGEPTRMTSLDADRRGEARAVPDQRASVERRVDERRLRDLLSDAIGDLEPMYREVLVLRDVEGLSAKEVAEALDLSVAAVKSRLHRARASIRARVGPFLAGPPDVAPGQGCPDIVQMFSENLEGEIDPDLCARMQEHVDSCPRCRAVCDSLKSTLSLCATTPSPKVPRDVQRAVRAAVLAAAR